MAKELAMSLSTKNDRVLNREKICANVFVHARKLCFVSLSFCAFELHVRIHNVVRIVPHFIRSI
jgi:hypothetical protein